MIVLNSDQRAAVDELHKFAAGPEPFFLLKGSAGTGKSTCIQTFVRECDKRVVLTAPTNKATKVLREMAETELDGAVDTCTIYSLLGLRLDSSGEVRKVAAADGCYRADSYNIVVVDEGSMTNESLFGHICRSAMEDGVKYIFMGDPYQLPPVNEADSQAMEIKYCRELTKVERHDNQILTLANHIRDVQDGQAELRLVADFDEAGGVYKMGWKKMRSQAATAFTSDAYLENPGSMKVIAWRNAAVQVYNDVIREAMFGAKVAQESKFQVGERVVVCQPIMHDAEMKMSTDEEGTIEQIEITEHPVYRQLTCYRLEVEPEFGGTQWVTCWVIHESSETAYNRLLNDLSMQAKSRQGTWSSFWAAKELIHDIRPCHAITAHRAQGSTYESVFVDAEDILSNRNRAEALRCLYVACTRPRRILCVC